MPTYTLTGDLSTLVGTEFPVPDLLAWLEATPEATIDGTTVRLGGYLLPVAADGTFNLSGIPSSAGTPLYQVRVKYRDLGDETARMKTWRSGWFEMTGNLDLSAVAAIEPVAVAPDLLQTITALVATINTFDPAQFVGISTLALNVKDYGAHGDGVQDDLAHIQAAIDAAATGTLAGMMVYLPPGTYMISGTLNLKTGVRLVGAGQYAAIIKSTAGAAQNPLVRFYGNTDMEVSDLTVDANNRTNSQGIQIDSNNAALSARCYIRRVRVINTINNTIRVAGQTGGWTDVRIEDCNFEDSDNGITCYGPTLAAFNGGVRQRNLRITGCRFSNVGSVNIQVYGGTASVDHQFLGVLIEGNDLSDFQQVGPNGPIPVEVGQSDHCRIASNYIGTGGTRGFSTGGNHYLTVTGNTVEGQSIYFLEMGTSKQVSVSGNVAVNCNYFINETGSQSEDVTIDGNTVIGTGRVAADTSVNWIKLDHGARRVKISGNLFVDWVYTGGCVRLGAGANQCQDVTVENNTFIVSDAHTPVNSISVESALRTVVRGNTIYVKRNLATPGPPDDDLPGIIKGTVGGNVVDLLIEDNTILYTGTVTPANHHGIGNGSTSANVLAGLVCRRNRVAYGRRGISWGAVTSADAIVEDNDTRTCAVADSLNSAIVYRRTIRIVEATQSPQTTGTGTWVQGDLCVNKSAATGQPKGWRCTVSGSPGTWVTEGNL